MDGDLMPPHQRSAGDDDRTTGEIGRGLDALSDQVHSLAAEMRASLLDIRNDLARTYLRADLYAAKHDALVARVGTLEKAADERAKDVQVNRRLAVSGIVFPVLVLVIGSLLLAAFGLR